MAPPRKAVKVNGRQVAAEAEALAEKLHNEGLKQAYEGKPKSILELAHLAVNGERMENYGDQLTNFTNIADHWTVILREKLVTPITPQDVAMCQIAVKLARLQKTGGQHKDSIVDVAGYAECLSQVNGY